MKIMGPVYFGYAGEMWGFVTRGRVRGRERERERESKDILQYFTSL